MYVTHNDSFISCSNDERRSLHLCHINRFYEKKFGFTYPVYKGINIYLKDGKQGTVTPMYLFYRS